MNKQILLVEDDLAIMETLAMFLRYEGYNVLEACNASQAGHLIRHKNPDLILLDYMINEDTAEPVMEEIRRVHGNAAKVVLITAADDPVEKASGLGADAVVAKPFELDKLLNTIINCLSFEAKVQSIKRDGDRSTDSEDAEFSSKAV